MKNQCRLCCWVLGEWFLLCLCLMYENHKRNSLGCGNHSPRHILWVMFLWLAWVRCRQRWNCLLWSGGSICYFIVAFEIISWKTRSDPRSNQSSRLHKGLFRNSFYNKECCFNCHMNFEQANFDTCFAQVLGTVIISDSNFAFI